MSPKKQPQQSIDRFMPNNPSNHQNRTTKSDRRRRGVIYVRVSSSKQVTDGNGIEGQIQDLKQIAQERSIKLVSDPIRDEGKTGTNFNRSGIKEVLHYARSDKIDCLLIDSISRLGRSAPETLYFMHKLQNDFQVNIITPTGTIDISEIDGLVQATIRSLNAEMSTEYRTKSSVRSKVDNFVNHKDWKSSNQKVPLGYQLTDDGWIETDPDELDIVHKMFQTFIGTKSYSRTKEDISSRHHANLDQTIPYWRIKSYLENPVYVGEPTIATNTDAYNEDKKTVTDPSLAIVSPEKFEKTQKIIKEISEKYSTTDSKFVKSAVEEHGLSAVFDSSPIIKIVCPDCGNYLRQNGQRNIDGSVKVQNYQCVNEDCGTQRRWPYLDELDSMKSYHLHEEDFGGTYDNQ